MFVFLGTYGRKTELRDMFGRKSEKNTSNSVGYLSLFRCVLLNQCQKERYGCQRLTVYYPVGTNQKRHIVVQFTKKVSRPFMFKIV